ncbi:hypothetical protein D6821_00540, partial [Candidatus Parcubacteria bacterium]
MNNPIKISILISWLAIGLICMGQILAAFYLYYTPIPAHSITPSFPAPLPGPKNAATVAVPDYVRGIYLTAYSASRPEFRKKIIRQIKKGKFNSVVIDIKDYTGYILYPSQLN